MPQCDVAAGCVARKTSDHNFLFDEYIAYLRERERERGKKEKKDGKKCMRGEGKKRERERRGRKCAFNISL